MSIVEDDWAADVLHSYAIPHLTPRCCQIAPRGPLMRDEIKHAVWARVKSPSSIEVAIRCLCTSVRAENRQRSLQISVASRNESRRCANSGRGRSSRTTPRCSLDQLWRRACVPRVSVASVRFLAVTTPPRLPRRVERSRPTWLAGSTELVQAGSRTKQAPLRIGSMAKV